MGAVDRAKNAWVEILGAVILCGFFLYWDVGRAVYLLSALVILGYLIKRRPSLGGRHLDFAWPVYLFTGVMLLSVAAHGFDDSGVNAFSSRYLLLLMALPFAALAYLHYQRRQNPWIKYMLAAAVLGVIAVVEFAVIEDRRASGGDNPVIFGFLAVAVLTVLIGGFRVLWGAGRLLRSLYVLSMILGLIAVILSGARGSWLALVLISVLAFMLALDRWSWKKRLLISLLGIGGCVAIGANIPLVEHRVDMVVKDLQYYQDDGEQRNLNSTSYRLETWKISLQIGMDHPWLGVGPGNFRRTLGEYAQQDEHIAKLKQEMAHAHNQYMQSFSTSGILGLAAMMSLLIGHAWLFARYINARYPDEVRSLAMAGLLLSIAYLLLGLTGAPLERKKLILIYGFSSATCWGYLLGALSLAGKGRDAGNPTFERYHAQ